MMNIVFDLAKRVRSEIRAAMWSILLVHLVFTALGIILFTPLLGALGRLLLALSSAEVLADTDIIYFLVSPFGMAALVVFGAMLITIVIFEQAAMMLTYIAATEESEEDLPGILRYTAARAMIIFQFSVLLVLRLLVIILPFLAAGGVIGWLALTKYDINYYLAHKPPVF